MKTQLVGIVVGMAFLFTGCMHTAAPRPQPVVTVPHPQSSYNADGESGAVTFAGGKTAAKVQNNPTRSEVRYIISNNSGGDIQLSVDGAQQKITLTARDTTVIPVTVNTVVVVSGTNGMFMMELTVPPIGRPARLIGDTDFE